MRKNNSIEIVEVQKRIPDALYDYVLRSLKNDQCLSIWQYCLKCIEEMADAWEEVNGKDLVWVPSHYEKQEKSGKSSIAK